MDPYDFFLDEDEPDLFIKRFENVLQQPINIYSNGELVAVAIHPEEYALLNRLITLEQNK